MTVAGVVAATAGLYAQDTPKVVGYTDTPFLPGDKWHVHDPNRPQPQIVVPPAEGPFTKAPADAIVLFDGTDLSKWQAGNGAASGWVLKDGSMMVPPGGTPGGGDILTKDSFGDMQLHIEWCAPEEVKGSGQGRGNSGIIIMNRYELQVLDCYNNPTYPDGQAGAVYGQTPPLVNASRPPGQWQSYDVLWTAPRFKDGKLESPAYITAIHNGVVVQNHTELLGTTQHRQLGRYEAHEPTAPLRLQDHGDRVRYRNIWVRPLPAATEAQ
ncbi:DUF1080 domain-containing protein [bacterium]|nr:MAG: DUF1080 domain-containing protein [bacterium]